MKEFIYPEKSSEIMATLSNGAFLTTSDADNTINTMTITWGNIGFGWKEPTFMVMVRKSRYTHNLIEKNKEFTLTLPVEDVKKQLGFCGTKSGRDFDKIKECGFKTLPSQKIKTPIIALKGYHLECEVIYKTDMISDNMAKEMDTAFYSDSNYHTIYFGKIVSSYIIE